MSVGRGAGARALILAGALVGWSFTAGLRHPWRRHPVLQAGLGTALALGARAPLGLRPPAAGAGLRLGAAAAVAAVAGIAGSTALPRVRHAMADRELPRHPWRWLALEIPLGTVWSEETAFRGALAALGTAAFGPRGGRQLQAVAFGLSHVPAARAARASPAATAGTVLVTGLAGWAFGLLAERSGSLIAPVLAHLAVNEAGAVAALVVRGT